MNRILILTPEFPPQPGGIGNHAWNLAKELQQNNYEVLVLTNSRNEQTKEVEFDKKQPIRIKRVIRSNFNVLTYVQRVLFIHKQLKVFNPEIILFSGKFSIWMLAILRLKNAIRKITIVHGSELTISNKFQKALLLKGLSKSLKIISVSNFTKDLIPERFHAKTVVINNGFNKNAFKRSTVHFDRKKPLQLVTVGAVNQRKGQHNVIKALPLLKEKFKNINYHIVGIPTNQKTLEAFSDSLGVRENVIFHHVLNQNRLNDLLAKCSIFIMLSEASTSGEVEGFGIALLEANYIGIPSIGSKNCGIEDAIKDRKSGILVGYSIPSEIENAIEEILNNYEQYRNNAIKWSELFFWEKVVKKYIKVIES